MSSSIQVSAINNAPDPRLFLAIAISGEKRYPKRPACVWVNEDKGTSIYKPINEIERTDLRDGLQRICDDEHFLVVQQRLGQAHIFKVPKEKSGSHIQECMMTTSSSSI
tara:strand:- start:1357 stop:1683 length:327 start_codon:yes stop_codon:yes gene_type:complete